MVMTNIKRKNKVNTANSSKLSDAEQLALNRAPKSLLDEIFGAGRNKEKWIR